MIIIITIILTSVLWKLPHCIGSVIYIFDFLIIFSFRGLLACKCFPYIHQLCVCVCVCVKEREREWLAKYRKCSKSHVLHTRNPSVWHQPKWNHFYRQNYITIETFEKEAAQVITIITHDTQTLLPPVPTIFEKATWYLALRTERNLGNSDFISLNLLS